MYEKRKIVENLQVSTSEKAPRIVHRLLEKLPED